MTLLGARLESLKTDAAALMGAVNCVYREGDALIGENTDGKGFVESLAEVTVPQDKQIVVLGAGGGRLHVDLHHRFLVRSLLGRSGAAQGREGQDENDAPEYVLHVFLPGG